MFLFFIFSHFILFSVALITTAACSDEKSFSERDEMLAQAFQDIMAKNDSTVIKGLEIIRKYPTNTGLIKTIALWETNVTEKVEKEIIKTLKSFETFRHDPSIIKEIFKKNYRIEDPKAKKEKLKRLVESTDVDIKGSLLNKIDSGK